MKKILVLTSLLVTGAVSANVKAGKIGVDFSYSGSVGLWQTNNHAVPTFNGMPTIGVLWHLTDMIALAPQVGFYTASSTDNSATTGAPGNVVKKETTVTAWGAGLEVPIYLTKFNALNFYVAPGFGITPNSTTVKNTTENNTVTETKSTGSHLSIYAAIGLQIPINDQLHVFGKTTIGYASGTSNGGAAGEPDDKNSYFGLQRWAVGAIFYFN